MKCVQRRALRLQNDRVSLKPLVLFLLLLHQMFNVSALLLHGGRTDPPTPSKNADFDRFPLMTSQP